MTAPPDDLVAELEQLAGQGHAVAGRASWRIQRLTAENKALRDRAEAAERAIEDHNAGCQESCMARRNGGHCAGFVERQMTCPECPCEWTIDSGCLAAGAANER